MNIREEFVRAVRLVIYRTEDLPPELMDSSYWRATTWIKDNSMEFQLFKLAFIKGEEAAHARLEEGKVKS
jgi:hypothetical protein